MSEPIERRFCADCGTSLGSDLQKCPKSGSGNKLIKIKDTLYVSSNLKGEIKKPDMSKSVEEFRIKRKIAGKSGNIARDELVINRRDKKVTVKYHKVEEFVDGEWQIVHEHGDESPAKHR
jgi:hypothetical protein